MRGRRTVWTASVAGLGAVALALGGAACGGGSGDGAGEATGKETVAVAAGDPEAGKRLFAEQGCGNCHTFRAAGATRRVGPDLDKSLAGDDAAHVRESLVDPDAEVEEGYRRPMAVDYGPEAASSQNRISEQDIADITAFLLERRS